MEREDEEREETDRRREEGRGIKRREEGRGGKKEGEERKGKRERERDIRETFDPRGLVKPLGGLAHKTINVILIAK